MSRARFYPRLNGQHAAGAKAHTVFVCNGCGLWHPGKEKPAQCQSCGRMDFERFDSKSEALRWAELLLLASLDKITKLRRQVRYDLFAFGPEGQPVKVGVYVADYVYDRDGMTIIEDRKPRAGIDDLARLKLKIMEAMGKPVLITST